MESRVKMCDDSDERSIGNACEGIDSMARRAVAEVAVAEEEEGDARRWDSSR
jgi:hypothetical protein